MSHEVVDLTGGLYSFMLQAERTVLARKPRNGDTALTLLERAQTLAAAFSAAKQRATERLSTGFDDVSNSLRELAGAIEERASRKELRQLWKRLAENYESLVRYVRQVRLPVPADTQLGTLKPINLWRNAFHLSMGVGGVLAFELFMTRTVALIVAGSVLATFAFLDVLRRVSPTWNARLVQRIFGKISRPSEAHRIPSATWYILALFLGVLFFPAHGIEMGVLILAVGDPIASLAGKRWGRRKLVGDKSVAGTTAFLVSAFVACVILTALVVPGFGWGHRLAICGLVAATGALTELFSGRIDDNFTIPLVCAGVATLLLG